MTTEASRRPHPLTGLLTVMWHYVRADEELPSIGATWVDPSTFDAQLDAIARSRTVVGWPDVAAALAGERALPSDAALLTFDDGLADHARTVAPRLVERGWSGVFFVLARAPGDPPTVGHAIHVLLAALGLEGLADAVRDALSPSDAARFAAAEAAERAAGVDAIDVLKRPLQRDLLDVVEPILLRLVADRLGPPREVADALHVSPADLMAMRDAGLTIGGHSARHVWFDHEPDDRVRREVAASAAFLASEPRPWSFAYPYGASSPAAIEAVQAQGFGGAFLAAPHAATGAFDLGRVDGEDASTFANALARSSATDPR